METENELAMQENFILVLSPASLHVKLHWAELTLRAYTDFNVGLRKLGLILY